MKKEDIMIGYVCKHCGSVEKPQDNNVNFEAFIVIQHCSSCGRDNAFVNLKKIILNNVECSKCKKTIKKTESSGFNFNIENSDGTITLAYRFIVSCPFCGHYVDAKGTESVKNLVFCFNT